MVLVLCMLSDKMLSSELLLILGNCEELSLTHA